MTTDDIIRAARERARSDNAALRASRLRDDADRLSAAIRPIWR